MKALKIATTDGDRVRIRSKCKQILLKAEEIKTSSKWAPSTDDETGLKAPSSQRAITKREEVILLEASKLHGFIFPPWRSDPEDSLFDDGLASLYT